MSRTKRRTAFDQMVSHDVIDASPTRVPGIDSLDAPQTLHWPIPHR